MKLRANHHIKADGEMHEPGDEFEVKDPAARKLIKCGAAEKVKQGTTAPGPKYNQAELEKMDVDGLKNIAGRMQVTGDKREDLINGILEAQKKGS